MQSALRFDVEKKLNFLNFINGNVRQRIYIFMLQSYVCLAYLLKLVIVLKLLKF